MKAAIIHEFGGPDVLRYEEIPDPKPRKDQVLVRVRACALNHLDLWVRKGLPGVKLPHINGSDVSTIPFSQFAAGHRANNRLGRFHKESPPDESAT